VDPDDDQVEAEVRWAVRAGDVEDEFLGAKAQQNWQGISLWTGGVATASAAGRMRYQVPLS
jgi:hypothetical protein